MPRILGVDIPNDKPTHISLRYIYGVGPTVALRLCDQAKIDPQRRAKELTDDDISRLASILDREYTVEGPLRRQIQQHRRQRRVRAGRDGEADRQRHETGEQQTGHEQAHAHAGHRDDALSRDAYGDAASNECARNAAAPIEQTWYQSTLFDHRNEQPLRILR